MRSVYTQDTRVTEHAHTANDETLWQEESVSEFFWYRVFLYNLLAISSSVYVKY